MNENNKAEFLIQDLSATSGFPLWERWKGESLSGGGGGG